MQDFPTDRLFPVGIFEFLAPVKPGWETFGLFFGEFRLIVLDVLRPGQYQTHHVSILLFCFLVGFFGQFVCVVPTWMRFDLDQLVEVVELKRFAHIFDGVIVRGEVSHEGELDVFRPINAEVEDVFCALHDLLPRFHHLDGVDSDMVTGHANFVEFVLHVIEILGCTVEV
jgi:hypothetical protein